MSFYWVSTREKYSLTAALWRFYRFVILLWSMEEKLRTIGCRVKVIGKRISKQNHWFLNILVLGKSFVHKLIKKNVNNGSKMEIEYFSNWSRKIGAVEKKKKLSMTIDFWKRWIFLLSLTKKRGVLLTTENWCVTFNDTEYWVNWRNLSWSKANALVCFEVKRIANGRCTACLGGIFYKWQKLVSLDKRSGVMQRGQRQMYGKICKNKIVLITTLEGSIVKKKH